VERRKQQIVNMGFGTWNFRSLYRSGLLRTVTKQSAKHVTFGGSAGDRIGQGYIELTFLYGNGNDNHHLGIGLFVHKLLVC
jgi:hypothetical protein